MAILNESTIEAPVEMLRFTTAGSVDDGKSTLIGRLLYDTKSLFDDQIEAVEAISRERGDLHTDLALFTDGLRAEREQKITIDVAYRYFATSRRKFIIADTPGHAQYTRNMVTGASTAELAIILIDACKGILTQSKRHSFLATLLQIPHLIVAINKMDLVDFDEGVYQDIVSAYREFAARLDIHNITYIPISALKGDNVVERSDRTPWYEGPTLLQHLESVHVGTSRNTIDFRYPVQYVVRPNQNFRGFAGQVASGHVRPGDEVVSLPSGQRSRIAEVVRFEGMMEEAIVGDSVVLTLEDEIDVSRGDMLVRVGNLPLKSNHLDATLCWMSEVALNMKAAYWLQHTTRRVRVLVSELNYKIDVDTMHRVDADTLEVNEIGRAQLTTTQPLFFDPYSKNRITGSFILIDMQTHNTVAAGMIRGPSLQVCDLQGDIRTEHPTRRSSTNVQWEGSLLSLAKREALNKHCAVVLWFTGLSGAGKSTLSRKLELALYNRNIHTMYLDGDNMRHGLNGDLEFSDADRQENIRRIAEVAALGFQHGNIVLCSFISPFAKDRAFARERIEAGRFIEIHVRCDLEELKRRDPKGLYARAIRGEIPNFTGISSPYEPPNSPEFVTDTDVESPDDIIKRIISFLEVRGLI